MNFNLASKLNNLAADQDELRSQIIYITSLAPNTFNNLYSIASSLNNGPNFSQTVTSSLALKADTATTYTKTETEKKISDLIDGAPRVLNTLNELSQAINSDPQFYQHISDVILRKQDIRSASNRLDVSLIGASLTSLTEFNYLDGLTEKHKHFVGA